MATPCFGKTWYNAAVSCGWINVNSMWEKCCWSVHFDDLWCKSSESKERKKERSLRAQSGHGCATKRVPLQCWDTELPRRRCWASMWWCSPSTWPISPPAVLAAAANWASWRWDRGRCAAPHYPGMAARMSSSWAPSQSSARLSKSQDTPQQQLLASSCCCWIATLLSDLKKPRIRNALRRTTTPGCRDNLPEPPWLPKP